MPILPVTSPDDPRLEPYRDMKDRELARRGGLFVAEGEHVVRRLLASGFPVHSLLLAQRRADAVAPLAPPDVPVYVAPDALMHGILGFKFHSGVIACGVRKPAPSLEAVLGPPLTISPEGPEGGHPTFPDKQGCPPSSMTLLICPDIINTQNMGAIIRIAAAFGVTALILGERCCDPFWRQSIRVSMGAAFALPIARSEDLATDLRRLRKRWGFELIATVLDDSAEKLDQARRPAAPKPDRIGLLLGSEAQGLDAAAAGACDRRVTVPMKLGTDSLNVAAAAAVFLYHFTACPPQ
jgi:tRNA G18 (ribose-2'-O)-methylase SpoU